MSTLLAQNDYFTYFDAVTSLENLTYRGLWGVDCYNNKSIIPKQNGGPLSVWAKLTALVSTLWNSSITEANQAATNNKITLAARKIENIKVVHDKLKDIDFLQLANDTSENAYYTRKAASIYNAAKATFDLWNKTVEQETAPSLLDKIRLVFIRRLGGLMTANYSLNADVLKIESIGTLSLPRPVQTLNLPLDSFNRQIGKIQATLKASGFDLKEAKRQFIQLQVQGGILEAGDLGEVLDQKLMAAGIQDPVQRESLDRLAVQMIQLQPLDRGAIENYFELIQKSFTLDDNNNLALFADTPTESLSDPHFEKSVDIAFTKADGIKAKLHILHAITHHCDGMLTSAISDWLHTKILDVFEQEFRVSSWHIYREDFDVLCQVLHYVFNKGSSSNKLKSESDHKLYQQQLSKRFLVKGTLETQGRERQFIQLAQAQFPKVYGSDPMAFIEHCYEDLRNSCKNPDQTLEPLRLFAKLQNFINLAANDHEKEVIRGMSMEVLLECSHAHPNLKAQCQEFAKAHIVGTSAPTVNHIESFFSHIGRGVEHFFRHHHWPFPRRQQQSAAAT